MSIKRINYSELQGSNQSLILSTGTLVIDDITLKVHDGQTPGGLKVSDYELPIASEVVLGGIKVGTNLSINEAGVLNASTSTITKIDQGFNLTTVSTSTGLIGSTGMTQIVSAYADDASVEIDLPFPVSFYGVEYNKIYVTSNSAVFFDNNPGYEYDFPVDFINIENALAKYPTPAIWVDGGNRAWNALYTQVSGTSYRLRWEGRSQNNAGSTDFVWELTFDSATPGLYTLAIGLNTRLGGEQVSMLTDGVKSLGTFDSTTNHSYKFYLNPDIKQGNSIRFVNGTVVKNNDRLDITVDSSFDPRNINQSTGTDYVLFYDKNLKEITYSDTPATGGTWATLKDKTGDFGPTVIALGYRANSGMESVAIGNLANNSGTSYVTSVGYGAGWELQKEYASAFGHSAGNQSQGTSSVAVGFSAGMIKQGGYAVAIGPGAGWGITLVGEPKGWQGDYAIAIGNEAGYTVQGTNSIAIGYKSGYFKQQSGAIAIGKNAGNSDQGNYSIAIGQQAGRTSQSTSSIVINATGADLSTSTTGTFVVKPVRIVSGGVAPTGFYPAYYNPDTGEFIVLTP